MTSATPVVPDPRALASTTRVHQAATARAERRLMEYLARRAPRWLTSDQLTLLGLLGQAGAGLAYALSGTHRNALWLVDLCLAVNWLGDSLDGTLARIRRQERPRFGFYVDHVIDCIGAVLLLGGLAASGLLQREIAAAMLIGFLLLAAESYLAAHTLHRFALSQGWFGPTELRLLLIAANCAVLRSPYVHFFGRRWLLFDVGGAVGAVGMGALLLWVVARHTAELYRAEPLAQTALPAPTGLNHPRS